MDTAKQPCSGNSGGFYCGPKPAAGDPPQRICAQFRTVEIAGLVSGQRETASGEYSRPLCRAAFQCTAHITRCRYAHAPANLYSAWRNHYPLSPCLPQAMRPDRSKLNPSMTTAYLLGEVIPPRSRKPQAGKFQTRFLSGEASVYRNLSDIGVARRRSSVPG